MQDNLLKQGLLYRCFKSRSEISVLTPRKTLCWQSTQTLSRASFTRIRSTILLTTFSWCGVGTDWNNLEGRLIIGVQTALKLSSTGQSSYSRWHSRVGQGFANFLSCSFNTRRCHSRYNRRNKGKGFGRCTAHPSTSSYFDELARTNLYSSFAFRWCRR